MRADPGAVTARETVALSLTSVAQWGQIRASGGVGRPHQPQVVPPPSCTTVSGSRAMASEGTAVAVGAFGRFPV
jgi:hypothetical protein